MAVAQIIAPASKLAIARGLRDAAAATSLGRSYLILSMQIRPVTC
jgi:hypothetical protein